MTTIRATSRRAQHGRTLIEVMVAITIGLMLSVGILSVYGANRHTYRTSADLQRMQAAGQLALDRLAFQVRMAGYGRLIDAFTTVAAPSTFSGNPVYVCAGPYVDATVAGETPPCVGTPGPHTLQIRYLVDDAAVTGAGDNRDCLGFTVPEVGGRRMVQNRFYIENNTLMCVGNGLTPAPLIPNVEDLVVMLRVGDPFTRAEQVVSPEGFSAWDRVIGVELCVLVRSDDTGLVDAAGNQQAGRDCRNAPLTADGRLRRTFTQVVTLRNRIL